MVYEIEDGINAIKSEIAKISRELSEAHKKGKKLPQRKQLLKDIEILKSQLSNVEGELVAA